MIADNAGNNQKSGLGSMAKKALSILPKSAPSKIYNAARKIPIARDILGAAVKRMVPEKITTPDGIIYLDPSDMAVSGALALGKFEPFETGVFRSLVKPGMNVVDIGAHIGYYSLIAAKQVGPAGKVFSFEPEPKNFNLLSKNARANGSKNIMTLNTALSDTSGTRELYLEKYNKGHHSFAKNPHSKEVITVKTETLDEALKQFGSAKIDVLKIDVEGAEPVVLRGMKETIRQSPNMIIFTEVYPRSMAKMGESAEAYLSELASLGFSLSVIDEEAEAVTPIGDIREFIASFPRGESFKNILAKKQ